MQEFYFVGDRQRCLGYRQKSTGKSCNPTRSHKSEMFLGWQCINKPFSCVLLNTYSFLVDFLTTNKQYIKEIFNEVIGWGAYRLILRKVGTVTKSSHQCMKLPEVVGFLGQSWWWFSQLSPFSFSLWEKCLFWHVWAKYPLGRDYSL